MMNKKNGKMKIDENKFILDACCGGKGFWFDKNQENTIYIDIRKRAKGFLEERPNYEINPDIQMDFTDLKFPDKTFKLVVWDPPHLKDRKYHPTWAREKYGVLDPENWEKILKNGFKECMRVLDDFGILIFKWNESRIKKSSILKLFDQQPLFGHTTDKNSYTHWMCFMKIPRRIKKT